MAIRTPGQIASELTNPILGKYPDLPDYVRPDVESAIEAGIEIDRAQHVDHLSPIDAENLRMATLNVYAPRLIEQIKGVPRA